MKRIIIIVCNLFLVGFFFPQIAHAVKLDINPNPGKVNNNVKFTVSECKDIDEARLGVEGAGVDESISINRSSGYGDKYIQFPATGSFTAILQCGSAQAKRQFAITDPAATPTTSATGMTITVDPSYPKKTDGITFRVSGCSNDKYQKVDWYWWKDVLGEIPLKKASSDVSSTGTSKADENNGLSSAGNWKVKAICTGSGGNIEHEVSFTVLDEEADDEKKMPTNIPPVSPVCREYNEAGKCTSVNTAIGPLCTEAECFISSIFAVILSLSGGIALLIIIYAGYLYMTSRGNAEQVKKAQELITSSLVGLLFIIFSFVIFTTIAKDILQIPGIE